MIVVNWAGSAYMFKPFGLGSMCAQTPIDSYPYWGNCPSKTNRVRSDRDWGKLLCAQIFLGSDQSMMVQEEDDAVALARSTPALGARGAQHARHRALFCGDAVIFAS
jgi:hypothetical protein